MKLRLLTFVMIVAVAGCARKVIVESTSAEWRANCTVAAWWAEAPQQLTLGTQLTVPVRRCEGKPTPSALVWTTSNPAVIQLVSADANRAVIKAAARGEATLSATSTSPAGVSTIHITVK